MPQIDFETFINGVGNDLKIAVDDFISAIVTIKNDLEKIKGALNLNNSNEEKNQD